MIVLPDADLDMAADAAVSRRLRLGRRALHGDLGDRGGRRASPTTLVGKIAERLPKVQGRRPGAIPSPRWARSSPREHRDKVASLPRLGREQGATVVRDGREDALYGGDGFFLGVSLLDDVTAEMDAYRDEIFGPVLSVVRVDTYDEALGAGERQPVRQRRRDLHARRRRGARSSSST